MRRIGRAREGWKQKKEGRYGKGREGSTWIFVQGPRSS